MSRVFAPPFAAVGGAMRFDVSGINGSTFGGCAFQRLYQAYPEMAAGPAIEAIVDGRCRTVVRWTVPPAASGLITSRPTAGSSESDLRCSLNNVVGFLP